MTLKDRLITAINAGELGHKDKHGVFFTKKEFAAYFSDITERYTSAFLPAATIGEGRAWASHTKYLFRIGKGVYRVHPDMLEKKPEKQTGPDGFLSLLHKLITESDQH